jgi:hypothetical protein
MAWQAKRRVKSSHADRYSRRQCQVRKNERGMNARQKIFTAYRLSISGLHARFRQSIQFLSTIRQMDRKRHQNAGLGNFNRTFIADRFDAKIENRQDIFDRSSTD